MTKFTLPDLSFAFNALEPYIDAKTMEIHHDKHHAGYVAKLNTALEKYPSLFDISLDNLVANLASVPEDIRMEVRNQGGGHLNHSLFWQIIGRDMGGTPAGGLLDDMVKTFGSMETFKSSFEAAAARQFGSGWAWLSLNSFGKLVVHSTPNQDSPMMDRMMPIMGLDVWEHAYYLTYQNRRTDYIQAFWNILDWKQVEINYKNAWKDMETCSSNVLINKAA